MPHHNARSRTKNQILKAARNPGESRVIQSGGGDMRAARHIRIDFDSILPHPIRGCPFWNAPTMTPAGRRGVYESAHMDRWHASSASLKNSFSTVFWRTWHRHELVPRAARHRGVRRLSSLFYLRNRFHVSVHLRFIPSCYIGAAVRIEAMTGDDDGRTI